MKIYTLIPGPDKMDDPDWDTINLEYRKETIIFAEDESAARTCASEKLNNNSREVVKTRPRQKILYANHTAMDNEDLVECKDITTSTDSKYTQYQQKVKDDRSPNPEFLGQLDE